MADNLNIPQVQASQTQKEVTINSATVQLSGAIADFFPITVTANYVLSSANFEQYAGFQVSGNTSVWTFTIPAVKRALFYIQNKGTANLTATVGSTTISVANGTTAWLQTDGTANGLVSIAPPSSGGGGVASIFSQPKGANATTDSGAFGTKGNLFFPAFNVSLTKATCFIGTVGTGDSIQFSIWTLSSATANLGTLVASFTTTATGSGTQLVWDFHSTPVSLTGGQRYAILVTDLTASATTALNLGIINSSPSFPFYSDLGASQNGGNDAGLFYHLASNNPATGNSPANGFTDQYCIALIGTITGI